MTETPVPETPEPATLNALRALIASATGRDIGEDPAALIDDIGLDGLDRQIIAMELEDHHHIEISDTSLEQWRTIADVITTLEQAHV